VVEAVESGEKPRERVKVSVARELEIKEKYPLLGTAQW